MRRLLGTLVLLTTVLSQKKIEEYDRDGEACGRDSVPYLIEIDRNGKPELFCDTPVCLESPSPLGKRPSKRHSKDASSSDSEDYPVCNRILLETVCVGEREWTSGLKEINNGTHRTLKTECCTYEGLTGAKELKTVLLEAGDRFQGGPVRSHGKEKAFDLIKEVRKTVNSENRVQYVISVYRMPCAARVAEEGELTRESESRRDPETGDAEPSPPSHHRQRRRLERQRPVYDDFDYAPRSRKFIDDYDLPPRMLRRMQQRRRMLRRRPMLEEYYDYDGDYVMPMRPRKKGAHPHLAQAAPVALALDDRLWPVNYEMQTLGNNQAPGYTQLPEVTVTNDVVDVQRETMPLAPPIQDSGSPTSLTALAALPTSSLGSYNAYPPAGPLPPPTYAVAAGETYAQAPYYGAPATKDAADAYLARPPGTLDSAPQQTLNAQPQLQQQQAVQQFNSQPQAQPQSQYNPYQGYQYNAAAARGAGLNGLFNQMQCFSGDLMVETSEGPKRMSELKTGDEVLSIEESVISFSPIIMFLHRDEEVLAEFNVITTANGDSIKLTNEHLIYTSDCQPKSQLSIVRAKDVKVGDCVMGVRSSKRSLRIDKVVSITKVFESGIYAPLTSTGDIIVNDVLSSCHSNLAAKTLQQSFFAIYRTLTRTLSSILPSTSPADLPLGVEYLTTALDLFIPAKAVMS